MNVFGITEVLVGWGSIYDYFLRLGVPYMMNVQYIHQGHEMRIESS